MGLNLPFGQFPSEDCGNQVQSFFHIVLRQFSYLLPHPQPKDIVSSLTHFVHVLSLALIPALERKSDVSRVNPNDIQPKRKPPDRTAPDTNFRIFIVKKECKYACRHTII